jgi:hypothetical protein
MLASIYSENCIMSPQGEICTIQFLNTDKKKEPNCEMGSF